MKYIRKSINKSIISEDLGITVHIERIQKTKNQVFWYPYAEKDGQKYRIAKRYFAYKREQI